MAHLVCHYHEHCLLYSRVLLHFIPLQTDCLVLEPISQRHLWDVGERVAVRHRSLGFCERFLYLFPTDTIRMEHELEFPQEGKVEYYFQSWIIVSLHNLYISLLLCRVADLTLQMDSACIASIIRFVYIIQLVNNWALDSTWSYIKLSFWS